MNFWATIYAVGAIQALLLATALRQRRPLSAPDRIMAGWMLLVALDLGVRVWAQVDSGSASFKPMRVVALFPLLHGSLFYLYVRSAIDGRGVGLRDLWHLAGFGIGLALIADLLLLRGDTLDAAIAAYRSGAFRGRVVAVDLVLFSWSLSWVVAAVLAVLRYRRRLRSSRSDSHPHALRWLVVMAVCQCAIWAIALGQWLLSSPWLHYRMIYAAVAAWVLLVGYFSLLRSRELPLDQAVDNGPARAGSEAATPIEDDMRFDEVAHKLDELMKERQAYRAPALSIAQLAKRSGYPEYLVSAVINRRFGCPFWDYVNRHRVEAARERLLDPEERRTVLDIAYDCGFTSKSTFNAAFKRLLGETPSACRQRAGASAAMDDADAVRARRD